MIEAPPANALHSATAIFRRALDASAVSDPAWPVAVSTSARMVRRAAAGVEPSAALDLFIGAVTAVEAGIRENDQATLDAGARLLHLAAREMAR